MQVMRRFAFAACLSLTAIGVGVGGIAARTLLAGATRSQSFAHRVLEEASLPPNARVTTKVVSTWLEGPLETPGFSSMAPLSDKSCLLLREVVDAFPPHQAKGTRDSLVRCSA